MEHGKFGKIIILEEMVIVMRRLLCQSPPDLYRLGVETIHNEYE